MPTPLRFFIKVAQERGNVDPNEIEAVEKWYLEDFPKLHSKLAEIWNGDNRRSIVLRWTVYSIIITILFVNGLKNQQFVYASF